MRHAQSELRNDVGTRGPSSLDSMIRELLLWVFRLLVIARTPKGRRNSNNASDPADPTLFISDRQVCTACLLTCRFCSLSCTVGAPEGSDPSNVGFWTALRLVTRYFLFPKVLAPIPGRASTIPSKRSLTEATPSPILFISRVIWLHAARTTILAVPFIAPGRSAARYPFLCRLFQTICARRRQLSVYP